MAKSYNEQLAEWVRQRAQSGRHEKNHVAFLSVKEDVREALEQGWPVKTIWAHMVEQKRIVFGYDTFLIYVKRHVRPAAESAVWAQDRRVWHTAGGVGKYASTRYCKQQGAARAGPGAARPGSVARFYVQCCTEPRGVNIMAKAHFILQGRGGVGKTLVAVLLAQALASIGREPANIDTDPVNATFSGYAALKVQRLEIMEDDEINPRSFDRLVEMIDAAKGDVVVDNGASSFVPLSHFLISNRVPSLLTDMGHQLVVHIVIAGAQSLLDTIHGFAQLARQFPSEAVFVVWLNPYYGPIEHEGKSFEQMKAYVANKDRVSAIVRLPSLKKETYGRDLAEMLQARLTFDEALALGTLTIMTRQRLKIIRDQVFGQIASATVI